MNKHVVTPFNQITLCKEEIIAQIITLLFFCKLFGQFTVVLFFLLYLNFLLASTVLVLANFLNSAIFWSNIESYKQKTHK